MARELSGLDEVRRVLEECGTIAVLGAHTARPKPAHYVPDYLAGQGYRILPVNPVFLGERAWGEPFAGRLADLGRPVDVVEVFRRSEHLPSHLADLLAMRPAPRGVWLQLGIRHDAVAQRLVDAGIDVVQDRCMLADHRALGLAPRP
ncbi:MAG: CoA-binding protein [Thermoanaerobaculia bacterium]